MNQLFNRFFYTVILVILTGNIYAMSWDLDFQREEFTTDSSDESMIVENNINPGIMQYDINNEIEKFYKRIEEREYQLRNSGLPKELHGLILVQDLYNIYYVINSPLNKNRLREELRTGNPIRIGKDVNPLARTLNIIFDSKIGDIMLILETKSKCVSYSGTTCKRTIPIFCGTAKTVKPSWRIDTEKPIKMANAVFYAINKDHIESDLEVERNKNLISKSTVSQVPELAYLINLTSNSAVQIKQGIRRYTSDGKEKIYFAKISIYSDYAFGDLQTLLDTWGSYVIFPKDLNDMLENILQAVELMHNNGSIHQDIKGQNILVYQRPNGQFYLCLADFGSAYDPIFDPGESCSASLGYESPEISAFYYYTSHKILQKYFHNSTSTLGRDKFINELGANITSELLTDYKEPHKKNDMWALGIVINDIYTIDFRHRKINLKNHWLISGLLESDRTKRLTIDEALRVFKGKLPFIPRGPDSAYSVSTRALPPLFEIDGF